MSLLPIGQEEALDAALRALRRGRVAQSQLIIAPSGPARSIFAETVARAQFCEHPDHSGLPCGTCPACVGVIAHTHPDLHWTALEGKLGIDEARVISGATRVRPATAAVSVFVVEACERLTAPAAAALLKTLEDPPGPTLFLFLAAHPEQMEPTLRSRCLPVRLRPVAVDAVRGPTTVETGGLMVKGLLSQTVTEAVISAITLAESGTAPSLALAALRDAGVHHLGLISAIGAATFLEPEQIAEIAGAWSLRALAGVSGPCLRAVEAAEANVNAALNWQVLLLRLQRVRDAC